MVTSNCIGSESQSITKVECSGSVRLRSYYHITTFAIACSIYHLNDAQVQHYHAITSLGISQSICSSIVVRSVGYAVHPLVAVQSHYGVDTCSATFDGQVQCYYAVATICISQCVTVVTTFGVCNIVQSPSIAVANYYSSIAR